MKKICQKHIFKKRVINRQKRFFFFLFFLFFFFFFSFSFFFIFIFTLFFIFIFIFLFLFLFILAPTIQIIAPNSNSRIIVKTVNDESQITTIDSRVAENVEKIHLEFGFKKEEIQKILEKNNNNPENAIHSLFQQIFKEKMKETNTEISSFNEENAYSQGNIFFFFF